MAWGTIRVFVARMASWQGIILMGSGLDDYVLSNRIRGALGK
jgi:hypothetical protein